jgi:hypothetical protein
MEILKENEITSRIFIVRGEKVMIDSHLSELYDVPTKRINEQVKRNEERFPEDFMFQLNEKEWDSLRSQFATTNNKRRTLPYVFTEHGVFMLSSVLNSRRAIAVNIHIMRVYAKLRAAIYSNKDVLLKLSEIEKQVGNNDVRIERIIKFLQQFTKENTSPRPSVGYKRSSER